jgi:hypothetical protein
MAAIAMIMAAMMGERAVASNMAFKMNKGLVLGTNLVSLPFRTPIQNSSQLCAAFGKTTTATSLLMFTGGATPFTSNCAAAPPGFAITAKGIGVRITETGAAGSGILVGSHIPGQSVTLPVAASFPTGTIVYGYPYHTTNANCRDICLTSGFSANVSFLRYGPLGTVDGTHICSAAVPGPSLRLGEGVQISGQAGSPATWVPPHY